jgi:RNA polymerase sigma factor (sigma-70 family)
MAPRVDAEDVVQSVCRSFFAEARAGRYDLSHGGDLWPLLVTLTLHKVQDQAKHHGRAKRAVSREESFGSEPSLFGLCPNQLAQQPSPLEALALIEQVEQVMRKLKPNYRPILELRLQGYNIDEIAAQCHTGERTVRRVLEQVKVLLQAAQDNNAE